ncbi:hypothetical protein llap_14912 [Limosa lapponica baueri]|uniref:DMAP1-binding domain-containing protein n=1 Tax=Limosa lapponica baueri TaxID=1758121 RepID=A0A2I0TLU7_LIMLA|nr:hypothetical protein llap_14912 [Limosa lapponica baueri]
MVVKRIGVILSTVFLTRGERLAQDIGIEGDITQKGYEKKRSKLIGAYLPQPPGSGEKQEAHDSHAKLELEAKTCKEMLEGKIKIVIRKEDRQFEVCALFEIRTKCRNECEGSPVKERLLIKYV